MERKTYPSDLSDREWESLEPLLPKQGRMGRPRKQELRELMNAVFYVLRTGCSWRMLPHDLPPWQTVYSRFRTWKAEGVWEEVHRILREFVRHGMGREPNPSALIIDSQSVKTTEKGGFAGTMRARRSKGAKGTSSSIRRGFSSK